ncbi:9732_t:CDS:2, partial [Dentiscutata heterogama]
NAAQKLASDLFYNYKQISDKQIKKQLKTLLENDKECSEKLQKLKDKEVSFNKFWSKKLYFEYIFVSNDEHTQANAVWTQAILKTIFDKDYVSPKINADYVDM